MKIQLEKSVDVEEGISLLPWAVARGSLSLPSCAKETATGPILGFALALGLQSVYCKESLLCHPFFFNLPLQSQKRWCWEAGEWFSYAQHSQKDTTGCLRRQGRDLLCAVNYRKKRTHCRDLIYFHGYWQPLNGNDGMKSNRRWLMQGQ